MKEQTQDIAEQALLIADRESNPEASRKAFDDADRAKTGSK